MSSHERLVPGTVQTLRGEYQVLYDPIKRRVTTRLTCDDTAYVDAWSTSDATDETYLDKAMTDALVWEANTALIAQVAASTAAELHNKIVGLTQDGGVFCGLLGVMSIRWRNQGAYFGAVFVSKTGVMH